MRVLIIGGMHGNEPLGVEVVRLFQKNPVDNIDVVLANEQAIKADRRFVSQDLNRSFPGNDKFGDYELKRAAQLLRRTKGYDVVFDFHNTHCSENDCGFVGSNSGQILLDTAWLMGLDKIIVADYDCINKFAPNCLSIEVSMDSQLNDSSLWYERIKALSMLDDFDTTPKIQKYRFVYRISLDDMKKLNLQSKRLKAFQPIDRDIAKQLGVKNPAYPIFIADKFTPYYYGGLLNKLKD